MSLESKSCKHEREEESRHGKEIKARKGNRTDRDVESIDSDKETKTHKENGT